MRGHACASVVCIKGPLVYARRQPSSVCGLVHKDVDVHRRAGALWPKNTTNMHGASGLWVWAGQLLRRLLCIFLRHAGEGLLLQTNFTVHSRARKPHPRQQPRRHGQIDALTRNPFTSPAVEAILTSLLLFAPQPQPPPLRRSPSILNLHMHTHSKDTRY